MPKLSEAAQAVTSEAESGYPLTPPGIYPGRLRDVTVRQGKEYPYWSWEFEIPEGHELAGRRFWANTSESPAAAFKMKEAFDAFGVPLDTDTDELCGKWVNLRIGIRTIQSGDKQGQEANNVNELLPYVGDGEGEVEEPF